MKGVALRIFTIVYLSLLAFVSPAGAAGLSGDWHCVYEQDDYKTTRGIKIVGGILIETGGFGKKKVIKNAAISDDFVFWNTKLQEFEFYPVDNKLVETARVAGLTTIIEYECSPQ